MTFRPVTTLCLMLLMCGCARGVSEAGSLTEPVGEGDGGGLDSGAMGGLDAMTGPALDAGAKDAGQMLKDAGMTIKDAGMTKDASMPVTCETTNACGSSRSLSSVAGDTGSDTQMATGMRGEWLNVHVSDTTLSGSQLKARFTLTSNGGANYDLFVIKPADSGGAVSPPSDCGAAPMSSTNATGMDSLSFAWDDVSNAFGESAGDGLILSVEVRHVSGPCGSWNLTIEGNK